MATWFRPLNHPHINLDHYSQVRDDTQHWKDEDGKWQVDQHQISLIHAYNENYDVVMRFKNGQSHARMLDKIEALIDPPYGVDPLDTPPDEWAEIDDEVLECEMLRFTNWATKYVQKNGEVKYTLLQLAHKTKFLSEAKTYMDVDQQRYLIKIVRSFGWRRDMENDQYQWIPPSPKDWLGEEEA